MFNVCSIYGYVIVPVSGRQCNEKSINVMVARLSWWFG